MGLLDGTFGITDPRDQEAARMAILAASLGMLSGRGRNFGEIAGNAGMQGMQAYALSREGQRRQAELEMENKLKQAHLGLYQQQAAQAELQAAALKEKQRRDQEAYAEVMRTIRGMGGAPQVPGGGNMANTRRESGGNLAPLGGLPGGGAQFDMPADTDVGSRMGRAPMGGLPGGGAQLETPQIPAHFLNGPIPQGSPPPMTSPDRFSQMEYMQRQSSIPERLPEQQNVQPQPQRVPMTPDDELAMQFLAARRNAALNTALMQAAENPMKAAETLKGLDAPVPVEEGKGFVLPNGKVYKPMPKGDALTELGKLYDEMNRKFPNPSDPNRKLWETRIANIVNGEMPAEWRLFKQENKDGTYAEFIQQQKDMRRAGATTVSVNDNGMKPKEVFDMEIKLRGDWESASKPFTVIKKAYGQIEEAARNPSPANDLIVATKFMKVIDEDSVVRESELHAAMKSSGLLDRALNYVNMLKTGQKLTPTQRADFVNSARGLYQVAERAQNRIDSHYKSVAGEYGLKPERVVRGFGDAQQAAPRAPSVGDVVDGYRFKGGSPNDQANWERAQ